MLNPATLTAGEHVDLAPQLGNVVESDYSPPPRTRARATPPSELADEMLSSSEPRKLIEVLCARSILMSA
jgi:hypothetical protein